jgi:hypothetical protein
MVCGRDLTMAGTLKQRAMVNRWIPPLEHGGGVSPANRVRANECVVVLWASWIQGLLAGAGGLTCLK